MFFVAAYVSNEIFYWNVTDKKHSYSAYSTRSGDSENRERFHSPDSLPIPNSFPCLTL
jgi:hypothetical protein